MFNNPLSFLYVQIAGAVITAALGILSCWVLISPTTAPAKPQHAWAIFACVMAVIVCVVAVARHARHDVSPVVIEPSQYPDLTAALKAAFAGGNEHENKHGHCQLFGRLCLEAAKDLELDGQQDNPTVKTGVQLSEYRNLKRFFALDGRSFTPIYPALAEVVKNWLDQQAGKDGGPLSAERRTAWCSALRDLGIAALNAAEELR